MLAIEIEENGSSKIIALRGELDVSTAPQLRDALVEAICDGCHILVDLEAVTFLDSVGIGILVSGLQRARSRGGELELVCTSRMILKPFEITGLDRVFTTHTDRAAAVRG